MLNPPTNPLPDLTALAQTSVRRHALRARDIALGLGGVATVTVLALFGLEPLITGVMAGSLTREAVRLWLGGLGANALAGWLASWGERAGNRLAADQALDDTLRAEITHDLQRLITADVEVAQALATLVEQVDVLTVAFEAIGPEFQARRMLLEALRADMRRSDLIQGRLHQILVAALDAQTSTILSAIQQGTDRVSEELRALATALREELRQGGGQGPTTITAEVKVGEMHGQGSVTALKIDTLNAESVQIALPPTTPALHQLRAPIGDFVGREQEIAQLVEALRRAAGSGAVAAISGVRGMGGVGKTELAHVVAHELSGDFPDAQIVVELRGASDPLSPAQALQSVIRAFEREARLPDDVAELQAIYRSLLTGKCALVLADDARDAAQVRPLLPPPGCALLITSRYRFTLPGMHAIDLGTLAPTEAEALLLTICPRIGEAAPALAKLCGYLPLALRISAGLLASDATLSMTRYLGQLANERTRLATLRDPDDPTLDVDASLALSYAVLDPAGQTTLSQLSVFVADFDLSAAQAVVMLEDGQIFDGVLGDLYRRSLLDYDAALERYSLHDLVRVFARDRLGTEMTEALRLRYAQHYEQIAKQAQRLYLQGDESVLIGLALFDRERVHIDAGWAFLLGQEAGLASDELLIGYADATADIGTLRSHPRRERIPQQEAALVAAERRGLRAAQSMALNNLGLAYADLGEVQQAIEFYEQVLAITHELGDRRGEGSALGNLGNAYKNLGKVRRAITFYEQDLAITRELGDRRGEGSALGNLGLAYSDLGQVRRAIAFYEQDLAIARELGDRHGEGRALGNLGLAYSDLGQVRRAIAFYEQSLVIMRELGDRHGEGTVLGNLGIVYARLGEVRHAIDYYEQQLAITRAIGDRHGEGRALGNLGLAYADLGDAGRAIDSYKQQLAITRAIGDRQGEALGSWNLGDLLVEQGEVARGVALMQLCVDYKRSIGHADAETDAAHVAALQAQLQAAEGAASPEANEDSPA